MYIIKNKCTVKIQYKKKVAKIIFEQLKNYFNYHFGPWIDCNILFSFTINVYSP